MSATTSELLEAAKAFLAALDDATGSIDQNGAVPLAIKASQMRAIADARHDLVAAIQKAEATPELLELAKAHLEDLETLEIWPAGNPSAGVCNACDRQAVDGRLTHAEDCILARARRIVAKAEGRT